MDRATVVRKGQKIMAAEAKSWRTEHLGMRKLARVWCTQLQEQDHKPISQGLANIAKASVLCQLQGASAL